jgi:recombination endonuclease VII
MREKGRNVREAHVVAEGHKYCPDCRQAKPIEDFPFNRADSTGRGGYCKPCHNARGKASKEKRGGSRAYHLKRRYGITDDEVRGIILAQRGGCGICGAPNPEHVDHDHVTGEVRGILCFNCNGGLGQFKDNIATMRNAIDYLKETSWQRVLVHPGVFRLRSPRRACLPSRSS